MVKSTTLVGDFINPSQKMIHQADQKETNISKSYEYNLRHELLNTLYVEHSTFEVSINSKETI